MKEKHVGRLNWFWWLDWIAYSSDTWIRCINFGCWFGVNLWQRRVSIQQSDNSHIQSIVIPAKSDICPHRERFSVRGRCLSVVRHSFVRCQWTKCDPIDWWIWWNSGIGAGPTVEFRPVHSPSKCQCDIRSYSNGWHYISGALWISLSNSRAHRRHTHRTSVHWARPTNRESVEPPNPAKRTTDALAHCIFDWFRYSSRCLPIWRWDHWIVRISIGRWFDCPFSSSAYDSSDWINRISNWSSHGQLWHRPSRHRRLESIDKCLP